MKWYAEEMRIKRAFFIQLNALHVAMSAEYDADVLILGAGLAGLTAARDLCRLTARRPWSSRPAIAWGGARQHLAAALRGRRDLGGRRL